MPKVKYWTAWLTKGKQSYQGIGETEIKAKAAALREYEKRTGKTGELGDFDVRTPAERLDCARWCLSRSSYV